MSREGEIQSLEKQAEKLQSEQKLGEALGLLEQVLHLKRDEYGEESEHYLSTSHKLSEICNIIAMIFLNKTDKEESCYEFLKKAEILAQGSSLYKAITYTNMSAYCKKTGKIKTAISYLQKAQEIQIKQGNPVLLADTHLNLCALLSQQDRHNEALEHILLAVVLLQDEFTNNLLTKLNLSQEKQQEKQQQQSADDSAADEDLFSKLAIAYHNLGVEFEFLKRFDESLQTYEKAVIFSKTNLGPTHSLTKQFEQVHQAATQAITDQKSKDANRKKAPILKTVFAQAVYQSDKNRPTGHSSSSLPQLVSKPNTAPAKPPTRTASRNTKKPVLQQSNEEQIKPKSRQNEQNNGIQKVQENEFEEKQAQNEQAIE